MQLACTWKLNYLLSKFGRIPLRGKNPDFVNALINPSGPAATSSTAASGTSSSLLRFGFGSLAPEKMSSSSSSEQIRSDRLFLPTMSYFDDD